MNSLFVYYVISILNTCYSMLYSLHFAAMKLVLYVDIILLVVIRYISAYTCNNNPHTDGCSIKIKGKHIPFFFKRHFTPACKKHDACYDCVSLKMFFC